VLLELMQLNRLRIERDLTYAKLAKEVGLTAPAVYRLLTTPNAKAHDRTLYRIRKYLRKCGVEVAA
jgi:transcriptional regulator with XRE-family HTH domain